MSKLLSIVNKRGISCSNIPIIGFILCCVTFYPGFMSYDSVVQYTQSKTMAFHAHHPPIMAFLWSILNIFFDGPQGMLFFHQALLWGGLYLWYSTFRYNRYSWLFLMVGFLPWVVNLSGVLWKDMGMAYAFLCIIPITLSLKQKSSLGYCVTLFAVIFYAISVRANSIFAIIRSCHI